MIDQITNTPNFKIHKDKYIYASTFIGGPLAAGYIIAENFKSFGDKKKYWYTLLISVSVTILLLTITLITPEFDRIPRYLIPFSYTLLAYGIIRWCQGKEIDAHILNGGMIYSSWRAALIALVSLVITILLIFLLVFLAGTDEKSEIYYKKYGTTTHQIQFNPSNFEKSEVALLSDRLGEIQYLDSTYSMSLFVDKDGKQIQIWVPYNEPAWNIPEDIKRNTELKDILSQYYPSNKIIVNLCDSIWTIKKTIK